MKCGKCGGDGHNKRTCVASDEVVVSFQSEKRKPKARKKKKKTEKKKL